MGRGVQCPSEQVKCFAGIRAVKLLFALPSDVLSTFCYRIDC